MSARREMTIKVSTQEADQIAATIEAIMDVDWAAEAGMNKADWGHLEGDRFTAEVDALMEIANVLGDSDDYMDIEFAERLEVMIESNEEAGR